MTDPITDNKMQHIPDSNNVFSDKAYIEIFRSGIVL